MISHPRTPSTRHPPARGAQTHSGHCGGSAPKKISERGDLFETRDPGDFDCADSGVRAGEPLATRGGC